jgi:Zn-dependent protease with chaperone function
MTPGLALLTGAVTVSALAPVALSRLDVRRHDPVPLIACWLLSMAGALLAAVVGVGLLLLPDHGLGRAMITGAHGCWSAVQHGGTPRIEQLLGAAGIVLNLTLVARLIFVGWREGHRRARIRAEHLALLRLAARADPASPTTLWLPHDRPLAFSVAGRPAVVVATDGLARRLPPHQVAAVLAHERAHLRGHHHLLLASADVLSVVFPCLRLFRQAPAALRELVEITADISAARSCGADTVRSALAAVTGHGMPTMSLAMGRDAVEVRLARLRNTTTTPHRLRRAICSTVAGLIAALLPFLAGTGPLITLALITCHT